MYLLIYKVLIHWLGAKSLFQHAFPCAFKHALLCWVAGVNIAARPGTLQKSEKHRDSADSDREDLNPQRRNEALLPRSHDCATVQQCLSLRRAR